MARGRRQPRRLDLAVLAEVGGPAADAGVPRLDAAAVRQRVRGLRHGGRPGQPGSPILPLLIRAALTSEVVLGHQNLAFALAFEMVVVVVDRDGRLRPPAPPRLPVAAMTRESAVSARPLHGVRPFRAVLILLYSIAHRQPELWFRTIGQNLCNHPHFTGIGKLQGIRQQVDQDLPQADPDPRTSRPDRADR